MEAAKKANSVPLKVAVHKFLPQGITGMVLLAESHISIHTWPELNYMAIDIFTCGEKSLPYNALSYLKEKIVPQKIEIQEIRRGKIVEIIKEKRMKEAAI